MKQKKAVEKIVENRGNVSKSMREAGYSENSAKNPKNLTESKGFYELCEENGLTDKLVLTALVEDIKKKPQNRRAELELARKILGMERGKNEEKSMTIRIIDQHGREKSRQQVKSLQ